MPETGQPFPQEPGTGSRVRGLVQAVLRYTAARGRLLQIEAQEAGGHVSGVSVRLMLGLGALMIAWLLAMPAVVVLAAEYLKPHLPWVRWEFVALALAGLHLFIALIMLGAAKRRWRKARLFEETLNQFQKDREWAANPPAPPN